MPKTEPILDGDTSFVGVNMRLDPSQLPQGFCSSARNKRFVNGKAATRSGIKKMPWTNKAADAWEEKSYNANDIVTYSGRAAIVEAATESDITSGNGTMTLFSTNANILNGDFSASSDWSTAAETNSQGVAIGGIGGSSGWAVDSGDSNYAEHTPHTNGADNLYQDIDTFLGCDYTVSITVSNRTQGSVKVALGTSGFSSTLTTNATHSLSITCSGNKPERMFIQASQDFDGRVDDITIAEGATPELVALTPVTAISGGRYHAGGPASNNSTPQGSSGQIGPFFQRDNSVNPGTQPPLFDYVAASDLSVINAGWNNLGQRTYGYGTVYGAGIFRDPNSVEYLLVATSDGVYATKESNPSIKLAGVSTISADVDFVQCFNVVVMFRGEELEPLVMERVDEGFVAISKEASDTDIDENDSDGTEAMPNGSTGLFFSNRLLVPHDKDLIAASDYLNYTRYQPILASFKINQGSEDDLVSLVRINNSTIACFKTNSIYIVSNIYGNLADITLDEVTREYGAVGRKSVVQVGSDVVFLSSKRGVTSLGIADNGKVTAVDVPLSDPIQPLIDRINWNYASGASAAYHNNRLYMAVPLDGATYNNAILVYDFLAKAWAGYDDGAAVKVKEFVETTYQGKRRLFFLSTDGFINLYDDELTMSGFVDEIPTSTDSTNANFGKLSVSQISDEMTTRGYTGNTMLSKRWATAEVQMATSDPTVTIKTVYDGAAENTKELTPANGLTFDRTKYDKPFYASDFVESMSGDDFFTPYRQDYSVDPDTAIALPTGGSDTGFDPDLHQHSQNRFKYRGEGKYVQLEVKNTNGRAELLGIVVGGSPATQAAVKQV